jgi:LPS sulfotransferase NodH
MRQAHPARISPVGGHGLTGVSDKDRSMFDGYIICGTPRTGSTLLCGLLASTKAAGDPHSFYRRQDMSEWAEEWNLPLPDTMNEHDFEIAYFEAAIRAGKGGTAIFGLRLMRENLDELSTILDRMAGLNASATPRRRGLDRTVTRGAFPRSAKILSTTGLRMY